MAGIYLHIPFCRQACHYCDFHFSTNLKTQNDMVDAIANELVTRASYFEEEVKTVYFGGGTPSLLTDEQLSLLSQTIQSSFNLSADLEFTLEANPEDLTIEKLRSLQALGVNRLSIGVQTFNDASLVWMNRIHNTDEALQAYANARKVGFENISIDLIYALPDLKKGGWEYDVEKAIALDPAHISLYGLTIEQKTVFGRQKENGDLVEVREDEAAQQYLNAIKLLTKNGYEQYEVSNFSKEGLQSRHNGSYWKGDVYLGVGPGAHSFNGSSRQLNVRNNAKYIKAIANQLPFYEVENLSGTQLLNERILTGLRTKNGISLASIKHQFGVDLMLQYKELIEQYRKLGLLNLTADAMHLTPSGFLVADDIALQLFFDE